MREVVGIALIALFAVGAVASVYFGRYDPRWRRLLPGVVLTCAAVDLLIAAYLWWFEVPSTCSSRDAVVCVINANQGFLTLLAVVITATGIWVSIVTGETVRRRARRRELRDTLEAVAAACQEIHHNLLHVAYAFDGEDPRAMPTGLSLEATLELGDPKFRANLPASLCSRLDPLKRTLDRMRLIQEKIDTAKGSRARRRARRHVEFVPYPLRGFVTTSLSFLHDCYLFAPDICEDTFGRPSLRGMGALTEAMVESGGNAWTVFATAELADRESAVRNGGEPIMCWFDDNPIGVPTFAFGPQFADEGLSHHH